MENSNPRAAVLRTGVATGIIRKTRRRFSTLRIYNSTQVAAAQSSKPRTELSYSGQMAGNQNSIYAHCAQLLRKYSKDFRTEELPN